MKPKSLIRRIKQLAIPAALSLFVYLCLLFILLEMSATASLLAAIVVVVVTVVVVEKCNRTLKQQQQNYERILDLNRRLCLLEDDAEADNKNETTTTKQ